MLGRPIACALLLCYLAACMTWHVENEVNPLQLISTQHPRALRLTRSDGAHVVLHEPQVAPGDSLVGVRYGVQSSIAASDVTQVATRRVSAGKTIGLFLGLSAVVVGAAVIACLSDDSGTGACSGN